MIGPIWRKYGEAATLNMTLYAIDGVDIQVAPAFAVGDVVLSRDEAAEANITTLPTDEGTSISISLSATEMEAARITITLIDQTDPKLWLDDSIIVETYGNTLAQHAFDLDLATPTPERNVALSGIPFRLVDSTDHISPEPGLTVTVQAAKDGAAFAAGAGAAPTSLGSGYYEYNATAADMDVDRVAFRFSAAGADDAFVYITTVST